MMENMGAKALEFAKHYIALVDALRSQGLPEMDAREEARMSALTLVYMPEQDACWQEACPLCGR